MSRPPPLVKALPNPPPDNAAELATSHTLRDYPRVALRRSAMVVISEGATCPATTLDIGKGGLSMITDKPIAPGTRCKIALEWPADEGVTHMLELPARTVYSSYLAPKRFRVGVAFSKIEPEALALLQDLMG